MHSLRHSTTLLADTRAASRHAPCVSRRSMSLLSSAPEMVTATEVVLIVAFVRSGQLQWRVWDMEKTITEEQHGRAQDSQRYTTELHQQQARYATLSGKHSQLEKVVQSMERELQVERQKAANMKEPNKRGGMGEVSLKQLLEEFKTSKLIADFDLQLALPNGQKPDAVITLENEQKMVVDSKVPTLPDNTSEKEGEDTIRKKLVTKIKSTMTGLSNKQYPSQIENAMDTTWMLLPNEAYLQAAYDEDGRDDFAIHQFAKDRNIKLVGPESLRSDIQTIVAMAEIQQKLQQQQSEETSHQIETILSTQWEDAYKHLRTFGRKLNQFIKVYNTCKQAMDSVDASMRGTLSMPKLPKHNVPPEIPFDALDTMQQKSSEQSVNGEATVNGEGSLKSSVEKS